MAERAVVATRATPQSMATGRAAHRQADAAAASPTAASSAAVPSAMAITIGSSRVAASPQIRPRRTG